MWTQLPQHRSFYTMFLKEDSYEIYLTDYVRIWVKSFTETGFLNCLKESNTSLEMADGEFIQKGCKMLLNVGDLRTVKITPEDKSMKLLFIAVYGFPLKLTLSMQEGSHELFFEKVTKPMLKTIHSLYSSQNVLRNFLSKKDKEIQEFKIEGNEIALRCFKTIPYNDEEHMKKYSDYSTNFSANNIPNELLEKTVTIVQKHCDIKQEDEINVSIKTEPASCDSTTIINNHNNISLLKIKEEVKMESQCSLNVTTPKKKRKKLNI